MGWDQLDRPVLYFRSFGQFAYLKIDLSVYTLSQLPSLMKALLFCKPSLRILRLDEVPQALIFIHKSKSQTILFNSQSFECEVKGCVNSVSWQRRHSISTSTCNFFYKKQLRSNIWPEPILEFFFTSVVRNIMSSLLADRTDTVQSRRHSTVQPTFLYEVQLNSWLF